MCSGLYCVVRKKNLGVAAYERNRKGIHLWKLTVRSRFNKFFTFFHRQFFLSRLDSGARLRSLVKLIEVT